MEYWFVIILSVIAVAAIAVLLFFEIMGDDAIKVMSMKHTRGKYINDQTAVICQSIKETVDSRKAYTIFVEYLFTNHKQFLEYLKALLERISKSYNDNDIAGLRQCIEDTKEMREEIKDQRVAQSECLDTIEKSAYIEFVTWIYLSNNCRFSINDSINRMADVCIEYLTKYSEPFPYTYSEQLEYLLNDICNMCDTTVSLIGTNEINEMRELRKRMSVVLDESYTNTSRLFDVIHDGRIRFGEDKQIALKYALNTFQELHNIIYTLRRFVLANICLTLSIQ